ncbi:MAG: hypothetical protein OHK0013_42070 [Sandaracinaceae bacterium]
MGLALGVGRAEVASIPLAARLAMAAVHATSAWLFAGRAPAVANGDARALASALPSLVLSGVAFRLGASVLDGGWLALFVAGAVGTCASLLALGRSFAIFAARRELVSEGPYRWVRHPAYACEIMAIGAVAGAGTARVGWAVSAAITVATVLSVMWRIAEEERLLAADARYGSYRERVRWRLLPGLW